MSSSFTTADNRTDDSSTASAGNASEDRERSERMGLKEEARSAVRAAGNAARGVAHEARRQSTEAVDKARSELSMLLDRQKDCVADRLDSYRAAVEAAANRLHDDGNDLSCDCVRNLQDRIERASNHIRSRSAGELGDEVSEYAQRRPEVFFGGLLLGGLIVARFLKASAKRTEEESGDEPLPTGNEQDLTVPDAME